MAKKIDKKKIVDCIASSQQGLLSHSGSIFRVQDGLVLHGINIEWVPGGLYLWRLVVPLFDSVPGNLTYSDRIPGTAGYICTREKNESEICKEILASPAARFVANDVQPIGLREFLSRIESNPVVLGNPHVMFVYATGLILVGDDASALENLRPIESLVHPNHRTDYYRLLSALSSGHDAAVNVVNDFFRRSTRAIGLA